MSDTKLIQKVLDTVSSLKVEVRDGFKDVNTRMAQMEERLNTRIDKVGLQVARLEDDTPTIEEFDNLEKRVSKLEKHSTSISK